MQLFRILIIFGFLIKSASLFSQTELNEELAFLYKLKLDSSAAQESTEEYIYRFQRDSWHLFKNDEFAMRRAEQEVKNRLNELKPEDVLSLPYTAEFSEYDFENNAFHCTPFPENTQIKVLGYTFGANLPTNSSINLVFANAADIQQMPIPPQQAEGLIAARKNYKNGKIDRNILLRVQFIINGVTSTTNTVNRTDFDLIATILQVDYFNSNEIHDKPICTVVTAGKEQLETSQRIKSEHEEMKSKLDQLKIEEPGTSAELLNEINSILSNSTLNEDLKASLIQTTIEYYRNKEVLTENKP